MKHLLTFDLEDWHQLVHRWITGGLPHSSQNIWHQTERLLKMLDDYQTHATFFVVGLLAEEQPRLVKLIAAQGHEVACHSYSHLPIWTLSEKSFEEDTKRSKYLLEDLVGLPVRGYRATWFSIVQKTLWALDILADLGFEYDSSIFPIWHRRYGIAGFCPSIKRYNLRNGLSIIEIPPSIFKIGKAALPIAGGGYFRLMPSWLIYRLVNNFEKNKIPGVFYFHPYEADQYYLNSFDFFQPDKIGDYIKGWRANLLQNIGRTTIPGKLEGLLKRFQFTACYNLLLEMGHLNLKPRVPL